MRIYNLFRRWQVVILLICMVVTAAVALRIDSQAVEQRSGAGSISTELKMQFSAPWEKSYRLRAGETLEIAVGLPSPSALPQNGRVSVEWALKNAPAGKVEQAADARKPDAFGISTLPTAGWRKVLHALDPDVYLVYRSPVDGDYTLSIAPVDDEAPVFEGARWRESGIAPVAVPFPRRTPWPRGKSVPLSIRINPVDLNAGLASGTRIEQEPNDTPEQAQMIELSEGLQRILISGGADDIEYFDNGRVGQSGDDWFRIVYKGSEPRLMTANLTIPDHTLAAQVRMYASDVQPEGGLSRKLLPLVEYTEGRNDNERVHQQNEPHRASINRILKPGGVYFLRAEANAPGYEIELRLLKPAPYDDPRMAVRQAMYDHIGQVDSWLTNRPRGASVERRIRDTGNLMGTHCMSCHTQSGVWGPAVPVENGYRIENIQNYRRLINVMYESLRPTNYLKDAANNTSLAPLDIGDGPAGTRVAGHNVVTAERVVPARKLHSMQAIRVANHVLQTADPSGINAAGPGSNVGQSVVYNYAGEILRVAWDKTSHPRYFAGIEEKAKKMLAVQPRYSDDMAHRIEFFIRFFPRDYLAQNKRAREIQATLPPEPEPPPAPKVDPSSGEPKEPPPAVFPKYTLLSAEEAEKLAQRIREQLPLDEARLRAIQNADGTWGFDPGKSSDGGKTWKTDGESDPAPTALALIAFQALGRGPDDPAVERGVRALLKSQDPYGRWNKTAQTGFVTTAYVLHALSRLYPETPVKPARSAFEPRRGESLLETVARVRALSHADDPAMIDLMIQATTDQSAWVRKWGAMGLGAVHQRRGVASLVRLMGDPVKMVRDAAAWAMEQTLLDDAGFDEVFAAYAKGDDLTRESVLKALGMRADAVMPEPALKLDRLTALLDRALNDDPHPAVRAWASKAAWQWWVWNPPVRDAVQKSWIRKLLAEEPSALVDNAFRYQSHALFIANGHKANGSEEHQYKELTALFRDVESLLDSSEVRKPVKDRLARRLMSIAATFYNTSGGDGGPGQMGYITPGSSEMMGKAALHLWKQIETAEDADRMHEMRLLLEGASGVAYTELQDRIIDFSTNGPEELRTLAAAAVSDPTSVTLPATQEKVQPLVEQIHRGAQDYDRRQTLAQPVLRLIGRAQWAVPKTIEQQQILYSMLVPEFKRDPDEDELKKIIQAAEDAVKPMGQLDPDWYIADRMGPTLASNPDLQTEVLLKMVPGQVKNPLTGYFWLPNVSWIVAYGEGVPEIGSEGAPQTGDAGITAARARAIELYLQMLQPGNPELIRGRAIRMANQTELRQNPKVREALRKLADSDKSYSGIARNALRSDAENWKDDLREAMKKEPLAASLRDSNGEPRLTPEFIASYRYFVDHMAPELNRPQRNDEMSCMKCHGVPGRVPSMELSAPDGNGYWTSAKMLKNFLTLQQRVNLADIETSKLLRKPLNVQTGKEDGHQGGRRYLPADRASQIIRRWALDQPRVMRSYQ